MVIKAATEKLYSCKVSFWRQNQNKLEKQQIKNGSDSGVDFLSQFFFLITQYQTKIYESYNPYWY